MSPLFPNDDMNSTYMSYVKVHLLECPYGIDKPYLYVVPSIYEKGMRTGMFVTVPFGKGNRKKLAIVVELNNTPGLKQLPDGIRLQSVKPICGVCRDGISLSHEQLMVCLFLSKQTLCTFGTAVRTIVPALALATMVEFYRPIPGAILKNSDKLEAGDLIVYKHILSRGSVSAQALRSRYGPHVTSSLEVLSAMGLIEKELATKEPPEYRDVRYVLGRNALEVQKALEETHGRGRITAVGQRTVLTQLLTATEPLSETALKKLPCVTASTLRTLSQRGWIREDPAKKTTVTVPPMEPIAFREGDRTPFDLNEEQAQAVRTLDELAELRKPRTALLYGVTGSGKTCVILSVIDRVLDRGEGVIMMVPEIALTPQTVSIFKKRYGSLVAVVHSGLTPRERLDAYRRFQSGEARIAVGTRSAVFAPVQNLGLIVMDEEQEHTYKSEKEPRYHTSEVAQFRCIEDSSTLILVSATPSVKDFARAQENRYTMVRLSHRYGTACLPEVRIVDMRREAQMGHTSPIGEELAQELRRVVSAGEQAILLLNRRGYASQLVCRSCGAPVLCPRCSVAMGYHTLREGYEEKDSVLICHWCGTRRRVPTTCPTCGSNHMMRMGIGTQRVQQELEALLPGVRVMRMDADSTTSRSAYGDMLTAFRAHEADILLGTQMVAKGHDFPNVTLVGVLLADMSLYVDDYRAGERTFSLLTQVIGRAGRADKPGLAIIQTMDPDNDIIRLACEQDYDRFYQREMILRKHLTFPPYCNIALVTVSSPNESEAQKVILQVMGEMKNYINGDYRDLPFQVFGPFEAPVYRVDNVYRMRAVVKCQFCRDVLNMFSRLLSLFLTSDRRYTLTVDFDPSSI